MRRLNLSKYIPADDRIFVIQCLQNGVITAEEAKSMLFYFTESTSKYNPDEEQQ